MRARRHLAHLRTPFFHEITHDALRLPLICIPSIGAAITARVTDDHHDNDTHRSGGSALAADTRPGGGFRGPAPHPQRDERHVPTPRPPGAPEG